MINPERVQKAAYRVRECERRLRHIGKIRESPHRFMTIDLGASMVTPEAHVLSLDAVAFIEAEIQAELATAREKLLEMCTEPDRDVGAPQAERLEESVQKRKGVTLVLAMDKCNYDALYIDGKLVVYNSGIYGPEVVRRVANYFDVA